MRHDYHYFKEYAAQHDLHVMFKAPESCNSIHDDILDGRCDAVKLTVLFTSGVDRLLASFGKLWTDDIKAMATKLDGWLPCEWQPQRDQLITDKELSAKLLANKFVNHLSQMSSMLSNVLGLVNGVHKETREMGMMVPAEVVSHASTTLNSSVETVAITYALWSLTAEIPKEKNVNVRKAKVAALLKQLSDKGTLLGKGMKQAADELCRSTS